MMGAVKRRVPGGHRCSVSFKPQLNLTGEKRTTKGSLSVLLRLAPIANRIKDGFGDITSRSSQSDSTAKPTYLLFCAAIKEMGDLKLD
ncbi:hypothetical protein J1N35_001501 [Gossypium stocksii]|uniref:Uncharacterized protein n=1 Tax=Gossypium stocksii TaxID=47602 RepID=A0A9D3WKI5_9ROSI|nr:hypothetical protein J1N35_001501 [Gossypium stocksii]